MGKYFYFIMEIILVNMVLVRLNCPKINFNEKNKINIAFYVSGKATRILKILKLYPQIVKSTVLIFNDSGNNNILHDTCEKLEIDYIEIDYKKLNLKGKEKNNFLSNKLLKNFKKEELTMVSLGGKL